MADRVASGKPGRTWCPYILLFLLALTAGRAPAQPGRVVMRGNVHSGIRAATDLGRVPSTLRLRHMTLVLTPSAARQADLDAFLARQQDPASPDYRRWLTPEQYAARFGAAQTDIDQLTAWLQNQNLTVDSVARGRNAISFSGNVRDVEAAFGTEIHNFSRNGETHFANASAPSVPAAFSGLIGAIRGLHDFRLKAPRRAAYTSVTTGNHYLAPDDIATIYDIRPLYANGINGAGQKIAVVGQTQIAVSDIQQFRTYFNLPASDPQITLVPNTRDPGVSTPDLGEADLDIEWSGAVARNATVLYVYSADVTDAVTYVVDQNLAPVVSMSYGLCEAQTGNAELLSLQTIARQGNAQGITWINASGDNGADDCYDPASRTGSGLGVDAPASVPEVTGVGGTTFNEGSGAFCNPSNDASHASALSYIPETAWNDSVADGSPSASGGGASAYFAKPAWQTGAGVPADSARDVPDISLAASADHDPYLIYSQGQLQLVGGTSVGTPVFAGVATLLNQYLVSNGFQSAAGLGNMNPRLYALAAAAPGAFHDVTSGDNMENTCPARNRNCATGTFGYNAGPNYDLVTGLGSVDAYNLVTSWHQNGSVVKAAVSFTVTSSVLNISPAGNTALTATVAAIHGGTPTGTVTWSVAGTTLGSAALTGSGTTATAALTVRGSQLPAGPVAITASYSGDATYAASTAAVTVTVLASGGLTVQSVTSAASYKSVYAPGMIVAIFGTELAGTAQSSATVPLPTSLGGVTATINGIAAPLYFVSPAQLNVQIPYEIPATATAILKVSYNGQSATGAFNMTAAAPGIFADLSGAVLPDTTAARGQTVTLFITGDGAASPAPVTGSTPPAGTTPRPTQRVTVSVGGVTAATTFVGVPSWSVGATQINYTVPATVPPGAQPVVVTVGGAASAPATLTVTP